VRRVFVASNNGKVLSFGHPATPTLVNVKSGRCLDIPGNVSTVGRALDIFDCNTTTAQRWALPTG